MESARETLRHLGCRFIFTFSACEGGDVTRLRSAVKDNRPLHPRDHKVCTLSHDAILDTLESVVDHRSVPGLHYEITILNGGISNIYPLDSKNVFTLHLH